MAETLDLDDGEFWLPSQFLSDDENNTNTFESKNKIHHPNNVVAVVVDEALFPSQFPYGGFFGVPPSSSSDLSSPLGGSSETESDEEEQHQIAELTRLVARSNLDAGFNNTTKSTRKLVSGSPKSTLCAFWSGCGGCHKGSSQGSPNSVCKLSSARATWDLLHAAAGKVESMRLIQEETSYPFHNGPFVAPQRKPSPDGGGFFTQQSLSLSHQQLQIAQFEMLRQQQMAKQQNIGSSSVWGVYQQRQSNNHMVVPNRDGRNNNRPLGLSASAWPSLQHAKHIQNQNQQQQFGSTSNGTRAVFLGGGRRECAGTGVFLPRLAESRKKPAAAVPRHRSNYALSQHKHNLSPQLAMNHEIRLPQEWTY